MRNGVLGHLGGKSFSKRTVGKGTGMNAAKEATARGVYSQMKNNKNAYKDGLNTRIQDHQNNQVSQGTKYYSHIAGTDTNQVHEHSQKAKEALQTMDARKVRKAAKKAARQAIAAQKKAKQQPGTGFLGAAAGAVKKAWTGTIWEKKQWQLDAEDRLRKEQLRPKD